MLYKHAYLKLLTKNLLPLGLAPCPIEASSSEIAATKAELSAEFKVM